MAFPCILAVDFTHVLGLQSAILLDQSIDHAFVVVLISLFGLFAAGSSLKEALDV